MHVQLHPHSRSSSFWGSVAKPPVETQAIRLQDVSPTAKPPLIRRPTVSSSPPPKARSRKHHRRQAGTSVTRRQRDGDGEGEGTGACPSPIPPEHKRRVLGRTQHASLIFFPGRSKVQCPGAKGKLTGTADCSPLHNHPPLHSGEYLLYAQLGTCPDIKTATVQYHAQTHK